MPTTPVGKRRIRQLARQQFLLGVSTRNPVLTPPEVSITIPSASSHLSSSSTYDPDEADTFSDNLIHSPGTCPVYFASDSDSDRDITDDIELCIKDELRTWALDNAVNHVQLSSLLKVLKKHKCFESLPIDSRTLLKVNLSTQIEICNPGELVYFGLSQYLNETINTAKHLSKTIELNFNIDGLPIFHSNSEQFWPILCSVESVQGEPYCVQLYSGKQKPDSPSEYLGKFVSELNSLCNSGFSYGQTTYAVKVRSFVCDAPARAYILCSKGHNGYSACGKCEIEGEYVDFRMTFAGINSASRTDQSFRQKVDSSHHTGLSPLVGISTLNMVDCFPFEYMHLVCLGVMKKLLFLWVRGRPGPQKLSARQINCLSDSILQISPYTTSDFSRKPRGLKELDRWKATEYRQFLLYVGPVVLKEVVTEDIYTHFMCLSAAISILVSPVLYLQYNEYAKQLLQFVVQKFEVLYGITSITYNVHGLLHLSNDAKNLGALDTFSAFKYESKLGALKKMLRTPNKPLVQLIRRIEEKKLNMKQQKAPDKLSFSKLHYSEHLISSLMSPQYLKMNIGNFTINITNEVNSYVLLKSAEIVKIKDICFDSRTELPVIVYQIFKKKEPFYNNPCDSTVIDVYKISELDIEYNCVDLSQILKKCLVYPYKQELIVFVLPHSQGI